MQQFKSNKQKEKVYTALVIVGLIASVMLFAGLSSAVLVRKMDKFWVNIHLPFAFKISTLLILVSSIFIYLALKRQDYPIKKKTIYYLLISLVLSLFFAFFNFKAGINITNKEMLLNHLSLLFMANMVNHIKFMIKKILLNTMVKII